MDSIPPPIPVIPVANALPQFTPENLRELEIAKRGARKVRRAVFTANFDGWTIAIFGALTLMMGFTNWLNILLAFAFGVVAYVELRNAARLKRLQADAAKNLGFNQLGLAAVLILYACWQMYAAAHTTITAASLGISDPDVTQAFGNIQAQAQPLVQMIMHAIYGALIVIAVFGQGSMALYYFSRVRLVRDYVAKTPQWIIKLQEAGVSL